MADWISFWSPKKKWCRTFWTPNWDPYPQNISKVHDVVLADQSLTMHEIVKATGISHGSVVRFWVITRVGESCLRNWVQCLYAISHESNRVITTKERLASESIFAPFHYRGRNRNSPQLIGNFESCWGGFSADIVMAKIFWDARDIIPIYNLKFESTTNSLLKDLIKKRQRLAKMKLQQRPQAQSLWWHLMNSPQ